MPHRARQDFLFGEYATDEKMLQKVRATLRGVHHEHRTSPAAPRPGEPVTLHITVGPDVAVDRLFVIFATEGEPDAPGPFEVRRGTRVEAAFERAAWETTLWGYVHHYRATLPPQPAGTRVAYLVCGWSASDGRAHFADSADRYRDATHFAYHVGARRPPAWLREAIIYQIFLDRFHPGPGRSFTEGRLEEIWGGTLAGVRESLPYLDDLGVTALWLSPVARSDSAHGYDVLDFRAVEPRLGTMEALRALVREAHARGMRVLLDFVANHAASKNPLFQRATARPDAPERGWFFFDEWPQRYHAFFDLPTLPKLNSDHPEARRYLIESARFWLDELGMDGFRLDHAHGVSTAFWGDFGATLAERYPESVTLGEVTESAAFLRQYAGRLDGVLDFIWHHEARRFFLFDHISATTFEHFLAGHERFFGDLDLVRPTFLDNHDMNRFLWSAAGDVRRLKLAALCQFTQAQPPIIYYGTEVGVSQRRDVQQGGFAILEESRLPMRWGAEQDADLHDFYRRLIHFRRTQLACRVGTRVPLHSSADGAIAYARVHAGQSVVTALNNSDAPVTLTLSLAALPRAAAWRPFEPLPFRATANELIVELPARGGALLASEPP